MRWRATLAATAVVACALAVCVGTLVITLRGTLLNSAAEAAQQQAASAADALDHGQLPQWPGIGVTAASPATSIPSVAVPAGDGRYVVAEVALGPVDQAISTLWTVLVPGVPLLLAVVAGMTWLVVGRALRPVEAIRSEVAEIADHDLDRRIRVPHSRDEIARLAATMNDTLDRLRAAIKRHRRFVADASHELRSPIAALHTQLELSANGSGTWPADAQAALADTERLQHLADDLLQLARINGGDEQVDLGQLAVEELDRRGTAVNLDIVPDAVVTGSTSQLARLLTNLVDNAERYALQRIEIRVKPGLLEVHDDGPGIPLEQREAVFRPFTRLDDARARDTGGAGLGLAIARDIVLAHHGTLTVDTSPLGGAVLRARLRERAHL